MKLHTIFFLLILLSSCLSTAKERQEEVKNITPITLIFGGDVMQHVPQMNAAYVSSDSVFDYTPCFLFVKPTIRAADLAVCNLETCLAGKPYSGYPQFSAPDELLFALKDAGFDVIQTANNHILDRGSQGLERTIRMIMNHGLYPIGAYREQKQRDIYYPPIFNCRGVKIGLLNFTYGTNGLLVEAPNIVNYFDTIQIIRDIRYLRQSGADLIVALPHWGEEYRKTSNDMQRWWTDFFITNGVDVIVGTHPHVVQEVEIRHINGKRTPVFYSIGNMISNQREKHRNGGIFAKIIIHPESKKIADVSYIPFYVHKGMLAQKYQYYLIPTFTYSDDIPVEELPLSAHSELIEFHHDVTDRLEKVVFEEFWGN